MIERLIQSLTNVASTIFAVCKGELARWTGAHYFHFLEEYLLFLGVHLIINSCTFDGGKMKSSISRFHLRKYSGFVLDMPIRWAVLEYKNSFTILARSIKYINHFQ